MLKDNNGELKEPEREPERTDVTPDQIEYWQQPATTKRPWPSLASRIEGSSLKSAWAK